MKKGIKLILSFLLVFGAFTIPAFSQQITKFGVVNTDTIYNAFFSDTSAIRTYEAKKSEFQKQINKLTAELKDLNDQKNMFKKAGDKIRAAELSKEIAEKSEYLTEYAKIKNAELADLKMKLENDDTFYRKLQRALAKVAESGGYSMILSLQKDESILWFSNSIDITNDVLAELGLKKR